MDKQKKTIGMVGVGLIGSAISERLIAGGFPVLGWDVDANCMRTLSRLGGRAAPDAKTIFRSCKTVLLSLPSHHEVNQVFFTDVRVPKDNILLGEGRGFEISQVRLGPGRIHHCMRAIGAAEKALELAIQRGTSRTAFGQPLLKLGGNGERIADARIAIDQARLLTLYAAWKIDNVGVKHAMTEISAIKVAVPKMLEQVVDMAVQIHGGAGMCNDFPLARFAALARALRLADGPDEVHKAMVTRLELRQYQSK